MFLHNDKQLKIKNLLNNLIFLALPIITVLMSINTITITGKGFISLVVAINIFYIFINSWYYFLNIYKYGTYTSSVQRFWKRTFSLFWIIEGFLFSIFIYLWLLSPQETSFFFDPNKQNMYIFSIKNNFYTILLITTTILFINNLLLFLKKQDKNLFLFLYTLQALLVLSLFLNEYYTFTQMLVFLDFYPQTILNSSFNDINNNLYILDNNNIFSLKNNINTETNLLSLEKCIKRTDIFYINLIILLKFWHVVFIVLIYILTFFKKINLGFLSMDNISCNHQNLLYLYFFTLLTFILFFKKLLYYYLKWVYFWFYENYHLPYILQNIIFEITFI